MKVTTRTPVGLLAGLLTVTLWASLPLLRTLVHLPPMLTATVAMVSAALVAQGLGNRRNRVATSLLYQGWRFWLMGVGGLTGALYFYFSALGHGDPAKITLVTYLWPLGFMLIADYQDGRGLQPRTLFGALFSLCGLAPLILSSGQGTATSPLGYIEGIASGVSWIAFSIYLKRSTAMGLIDYKYLFVGAAIAACVLHVLFETTPEKATAMDWFVASLIGIGPYGVAFMTWGYALLRSPSTLLGILTYLVPIISSLLLVVVGRAVFSLPLLIAFIGVLGSAAITQVRIKEKPSVRVPVGKLKEFMMSKYQESIKQDCRAGHQFSGQQNSKRELEAIYMPAMPPLEFLVWSKRKIYRLFKS